MKKKRLPLEKLYGTISLPEVPRCECGNELPRIDWRKVWRKYKRWCQQNWGTEIAEHQVIRRLVEAELKGKK